MGRFDRETEALRKSWMRHGAAELRDYLVQDVEDPRINIQSILTRHFLLGRLAPGRFQSLMDHELRFAVLMNWLLRLIKAAGGSGLVRATLYAVLGGREHAPEMQVPEYISDIYTLLPAEADGRVVPDYVTDLLTWSAPENDITQIDERILDTFVPLWRQELERAPSTRLRVLEVGCGSANDYRFLDRFGLAPFLDYRGIDLCPTNVANAQAMFPGVRFEAGNVLQIEAADRAVECTFVHDLLEHLSPEALEVAVSELCRVTARAVCVGCFSMHEGPEHMVRPVEDYHWNTLSLPRLRDLFLRHARSVQAVHIDQMLQKKFNCPDTHNKLAWTLLATF